MNKQLLMMMTVTMGLALIGCRGQDAAAPRLRSAALPAGSFTPAWSADLGLARDSVDSLHLEEQTLFVETRGNSAYALSRQGGARQFFIDINASGGILRPPVVLEQYIIFPTASTLEVFNHRGRHQQRIPLDYATRGRAAGAGNMIYIGLEYPSGGRVAAVDVTKLYGHTRWELFTRGGVSAKPAVHSDNIYIGSEVGRVYAISRARTPIWPLEGGFFQTGDAIVADLKADDFGLYVASTDSKLYVLDRANGKILWQYFAGRALKSSPQVTADSVYQYVPGKGVVALDKTTGQFNRQPRWIARGTDRFLAADEQNVYLAAESNQIVAVDKITGKEKFRSRGKYDSFTSNTTDGIIYAATKAGRIYGIRPVLKAGEVGELASTR